jgi:hypothetical protein
MGEKGTCGHISKIRTVLPIKGQPEGCPLPMVEHAPQASKANQNAAHTGPAQASI